MTDKDIEILSAAEQVDMADEWYEHATLNHFWIKSRYTALKKVNEIKNLADKNLFEVGCGHGVIMEQFEQQPGVTVDGCDLNMYALKKIGKVKGRKLCLNVFDKPEALLSKYDGVLLMDIIEHIDNDSEFLKTSLAYVKPNGLVVINVPALNSLYSKYDEILGHKRRYTTEMLRTLFEKNGIEEIKIQYWGLFLMPIAMIRKVVMKYTAEDKIAKNGFKPPNALINKLFGMLLSVEAKLFKSPFIGTSVVAVGRLKTV
jgi:2-polyprenyl-3-methyl-5-hydroxy-6-metoxy-1,4-benzoquinol methylase